jgi:pimeloyl-ACP methyl ester carboxylesterase
MNWLNRIAQFIAVLVILHFLQACTKKDGDALVYRSFKKANVRPTILNTEVENANVRFIQSGDSTQNHVIVFVHGAPGSADAFYRYLQDSILLKDYLMVSVDRLGYGDSEKWNAEPSVVKQAEALKPIIDHYYDQGKSVLLVGHSYGGPIVAKLAMDLPQKVSGVMLLAPAIDPENEKIFWFSKLGKTPPTSWVTPKPMKVATVEKFGHVEALNEIVNDWHLITQPVIYMHGDNDMIAPYVNIHFAKKKLTNAKTKFITIEGENHFLPWKQYDLVKENLFVLTEMAHQIPELEYEK